MRDGQTLSLSCNRCHDRLCLPCQRDRQSAVVEGVTLRMLDCGSDVGPDGAMARLAAAPATAIDYKPEDQLTRWDPHR